ncbi:unnamed protein product [Brassica oleracea]
MLQIALYLSCGATACYLWGRRIKGKADSFNSITRVADIKCLDDLLKEKATNLLVVLSGKVASATPFNCKHENDSSSGDVFEAKMLQIALYLSCGATACYLWGRRIKGKADSFNSITRVADIKCLDDLLKEKATNLLVVLSGKVASATPFNCKHENDSSSGDVFEAKMLQIALYLSCGATACYLWGRRIKGKADSFNSITRVADIKCLDDLLKEKATNLLVVLSGKVASATPFNCKHENDSSSGDVFEAKFEMGYETKKDDDGGLINKSHNFLLQIKETPWYLEDGTGLVKVVRAELADGYVDTLKPQFDMSSMSEIFQRFENPQEGSKVICRGALDTATSLTIIGEAARDESGTLSIQKPKEQSFMIFSGEGSFDKMVGNFKSNSEFYFFYSKIFGTIAVAIAVVKGVGFLRRVLRERSENATDSDNEDNP